VAGDLMAMVTVGGVSSSSEQVATVTPTVTESAADLATDATSLVIHGFGFSITASDDSIAFADGATGVVTKATATTLTVTDLVGLTAGSLKAIVISNGVSSGADVEVANVT
jgi:hypothetical protein